MNKNQKREIEVCQQIIQSSQIVNQTVQTASGTSLPSQIYPSGPLNHTYIYNVIGFKCLDGDYVITSRTADNIIEYYRFPKQYVMYVREKIIEDTTNA